jgi:hypothetical protein
MQEAVYYIFLTIFGITLGQNDFENCKATGFLLADNVCQESNYRQNAVPEKPLTVETEITLFDVRDVNEVELTMSTILLIALEWKDPHLIFNPAYLTDNHLTPLDVRNLDRLWYPALFMANLVTYEGTQNLH